MYKHILVPTDGSPLSMKAVRTARGLARDMKAKVTVLNVMPAFAAPMMEEAALVYTAAYTEREFRKSTRQHAEKVLARAQAELAAKKVASEVEAVTDSQPWAAIVRTAKKHRCDLVVMASHGRRGLAGILLGSETTKVLTHSKTPVLVCR